MIHFQKDILAEWMRESLETGTIEDVDEDWSPPVEEPKICSSSPHTEGDTSIMQRALCPWEARVNYEEARHPHIISEAMCLCRRNTSPKKNHLRFKNRNLELRKIKAANYRGLPFSVAKNTQSDFLA
ncbi:hypothetical protein WR25_23613 [Diploscapter pachys]|uniref:Uncharacterized protein n=1 Tax=Diploscapter pachys TaxID=2018661 RepID=A0A2A2J6V4_9BILA|nr:hypothetical protein WR25_23613 [Diploscapter pachys]